jgi:hypothetical protein
MAHTPRSLQTANKRLAYTAMPPVALLQLPPPPAPSGATLNPLAWYGTAMQAACRRNGLSRRIRPLCIHTYQRAPTRRIGLLPTNGCENNLIPQNSPIIAPRSAASPSAAPPSVFYRTHAGGGPPARRDPPPACARVARVRLARARRCDTAVPSPTSSGPHAARADAQVRPGVLSDVACSARSIGAAI